MRKKSSFGVTAGSAKVAEKQVMRYSAETRTPSGGVLARDCELAWCQIFKRRVSVPFGVRGVPCGRPLHELTKRRRKCC
jgi:hypothetical protein